MNVSGFFNALETYFQQGGFVMAPLAVATMVLWYALGLRLYTLQRGSRASCRALLDRAVSGKPVGAKGIVDSAIVRAVQVCSHNPRAVRRPILNDVLHPFERELRKGKTTIRSIVSAAPLAGLLGTVIGMIETFESLGDMALFSQTGGIAGGISQALFTTQMGLAVAVPGVIAGRLLDRRQAKYENELSQVKEWLAGSSHLMNREAYASSKSN